MRNVLLIDEDRCPDLWKMYTMLISRLDLVAIDHGGGFVTVIKNRMGGNGLMKKEEFLGYAKKD